MSYKQLGLVVALGVMIATMSWAAGKGKVPDSTRIDLLELQVQSLQAEVMGEHEWADKVNMTQDALIDRTDWLHAHIVALENRGPVAQR